MNEFYRYPEKPDEIFHYGMPRRSGRYPWGSGERPHQRLERKTSRIEEKMSKRFDKADKRISKRQQYANKKFDKAIRKHYSFFGTEAGEQKAMDKASKAQRKVNQEEYKMSKMYEKYQKKFDKWDVTMNADLRKRGLEYYDRVIENSKALQNMAMSRDVGFRTVVR